MAFVIVGVTLALSVTPALAVGPIKATVLFFNDSHGHLEPFIVKADGGRQEVGGIARMATLVRQIREENRGRGIATFLLVAGDILQGTPMSTVYRGRADIACFNAMGVNAISVGNHEFDFGPDNFLSLTGQAAFPFISANLFDKASGNLLVAPHVALPLGEGLSLTVIGATTASLKVTTLPDHVKGLDVGDPRDAVAKTWATLKDKGPVILLSHCEHEEDIAMAKALPDLTAIIGGHDHLLFSPPRQAGDVPIVQAFEYGRYLGRLDFDIDPGQRQAKLAAWAYLPVTADIVADPQVEAIVGRYRKQLDKRFTEVIGRAAVALEAERRVARWQETNLGNLVADLMRAHTGADIALVNAGSLRASIEAGPVTLEQVFKAMPFENQLVRVRLTGARLIEVLTRSIQGRPEDEDGGFLQVSGLWLKLKGQALAEVTVGPERRPLAPEATYTVAINDFMATGGDGYAMLTGLTAEATGLPLRELLVDAFAGPQPVTAAVEGRIVRLVP